ncbi:MAG: SDR family NAD(P)-dependent oxidoreductase, partial [Myxococcota bacterium]
MTGHVVLTGAAGAIGGAIARAIRARSGSTRITAVDRDRSGLRAIADAVGARAIEVDLAEPGVAARIVAEAWDEAPIDGLVNAAGFMEVHPFEALRWDRGAELLQVDLVAPLHLMHAAVGAMLEAGRGGTVVNVTSMAGVAPLKGCTFYGAAKAGLAMASEIARAELADRGIHVLTVYPGPVASGLERGARAQYRPSRIAGMVPTGSPEVLAARILAAVDRRAARVVYPRWYAL